MLNLQCIQEQYNSANWLYNPETVSHHTPVPVKKYFRVVHRGRSLFLSSAGKKSLYQLGIGDEDEIEIEGIQLEANDTEVVPKRPKPGSKKAKKHKGTKKKAKAKSRSPPPTEPKNFLDIDN